MIVAWLRRVAVHMLCCQGSALGSSLVCLLACVDELGETNSRSVPTLSLNLSTIRDVATDTGVGGFHIRQALQVSTMLSTVSIALSGAPAAWRMRFMRVAGACHHLRCNILSVRRTTPRVCERKSCRVLPRSNLVQGCVSLDACVPNSLVPVLPAPGLVVGVRGMCVGC